LIQPISAALTRTAATLLALAAVSRLTAEETFAGFGRAIQEFRLGNGVRFAVLERHTSPAIAVHVRIRAGVTDEGPDQRHAATMLSRLFIHGSATLGSRDPAQEKAFMEAAERHGDEIAKEAARGDKANPLLSQDADIKARIARDEALRYGHTFFFRDAFAAQAVAGLTAQAGPDAFQLAGAASSTRAEFLFKAFGEWVRKPALRAYYLERRVHEDLLDREKPNPIRLMQASLLTAAFDGLPYAKLQPGIEILRLLRPAQVEEFIARRFVGGNVAVAVVGDITAAEAKRLAGLYFGKTAAGGADPEAPAGAREAVSEKRIEVPFTGAEALTLAWYRPPGTHEDAVLFEVLDSLLSAGPSSLLHQALLGADRLARHVRVSSSYPGDRRPNLFAIECSPAPGHTAGELEKAVDRVLDRLRNAPPAAADTARAKSSLRRQYAAALDTNQGAAAALARFSLDFGSGAALVAAMDRIQKINPEDLQRVVRQWLKPGARFVVRAGTPGMYAPEDPQ